MERLYNGSVITHILFSPDVFLTFATSASFSHSFGITAHFIVVRYRRAGKMPTPQEFHYCFL
ncbi:hypothetical protein PN481_09480 [Nodularia spumigena CS-588/06]|nr:hypothetical protein [Nodularia spumigena CS-588/06]